MAEGGAVVARPTAPLQLLGGTLKDGALVWLREGLLGAWLAFLGLQVLSGLFLVAPPLLSGSAGSELPWRAIHRGAGVGLAAGVVLLVIGHPRAKVRPDGALPGSSPCPGIVVTRRLGMASALALGLLGASGLWMVAGAGPSMGPVGLDPMRLHRAAAMALACVLPVHLVIAVRRRLSRWRRRAAGGVGTPSRYRAGWWPVCGVAFGLMGLALLGCSQVP